MLKGIGKSLRTSSGIYCGGFLFIFSGAWVFLFGWFFWFFFCFFFSPQLALVTEMLVHPCLHRWIFSIAQLFGPAGIHIPSPARIWSVKTDREGPYVESEKLLLTPVLNTIWKRKLKLGLSYKWPRKSDFSSVFITRHKEGKIK